jgi:hypothetical protein
LKLVEKLSFEKRIEIVLEVAKNHTILSTTDSEWFFEKVGKYL